MSEQNHPLGELMGTTMQKIKEIAGANTVIGEPITTLEGITLIPVSRLSFGFASGGSDFTGKHQKAEQSNPFGGAGGAGVQIIPVCFLVVKGDSVRVIPISEPAITTFDRVVEMVPQVIDKVTDWIDKGKEKDKEGF